MPQHFKIHQDVDAKDLAELEEFARHPARTIDECHEWLQAKGYTMSRGAVANWKRGFLINDRFASSNETARAVVAAASQGGAVSISDAALLTLSQMLFESLITMQESGQIDAKDLKVISVGLKNITSAKKSVEELRDRQKEALAEASRLAGDGADGNAVVKKVREILGMAA